LETFLQHSHQDRNGALNTANLIIPMMTSNNREQYAQAEATATKQFQNSSD